MLVLLDRECFLQMRSPATPLMTAETLLIRLLRGAGSDGLSAITPGPQHPILGLRRHDTVALCDDAGIAPVIDPTNDDPSMWRNRIRNEVLPLLNDIAERDCTDLVSHRRCVTPRRRVLNDLRPRLIRPMQRPDADPVLATRALRQWLTVMATLRTPQRFNGCLG